MTNPIKRAIKAMLYPLYERRLLRQLDFTQTPRHVGVILDGNRRWAKSNFGANPEEGHRAGADQPGQGRGIDGKCQAVGGIDGDQPAAQCRGVTHHHLAALNGRAAGKAVRPVKGYRADAILDQTGGPADAAGAAV